MSATRWMGNKLEGVVQNQGRVRLWGLWVSSDAGGAVLPLFAGRSLHIRLWDRLWLNDSSEAHIGNRISPWAGVPQRDRVKLVQSSYPFSSYILDPLMFSSITYCPPWAFQWFTPYWSNLPPLHLLFTSPFLLPNIIYSVTLTSQPWAIPNKPPPMDKAKMSVVLLLSLPQLRWQPVAWQCEVNHPPSSRPPSLPPNPVETCCKRRQLTVWSTKAF